MKRTKLVYKNGYIQYVAEGGKILSFLHSDGTVVIPTRRTNVWTDVTIVPDRGRPSCTP